MSSTAAASVSSPLGQAICARGALIEKAIKAQDAEGVAALYTETARFMPPGAHDLVGRAAIRDNFQGAFKAGIRSAQLKTVEILPFGPAESATMVLERGEFTMYAEDGKTVIDHGRYHNTWSKQEGEWKIHLDIFSSYPKAQ